MKLWGTGANLSNGTFSQVRERRPEAAHPVVFVVFIDDDDRKVEAKAGFMEGESLKEDETQESQAFAIAMETSRQARQPARG